MCENKISLKSTRLMTWFKLKYIIYTYQYILLSISRILFLDNKHAFYELNVEYNI